MRKGKRMTKKPTRKGYITREFRIGKDTLTVKGPKWFVSAIGETINKAKRMKII